jgi:hypothetical protein
MPSNCGNQSSPTWRKGAAHVMRENELDGIGRCQDKIRVSETIRLQITLTFRVYIYHNIIYIIAKRK